MAQGLLSKGIKFEYSTDGTAYTEVKNLQEIPSLGGTPDKVDVTCLADGNKKYINNCFLTVFKIFLLLIPNLFKVS